MLCSAHGPNYGARPIVRQLLGCPFQFAHRNPVDVGDGFRGIPFQFLLQMAQAVSAVPQHLFVFPAVLEQLAEDMRDVESRLKELYVGVLTQTIQGEIVSTLQDLVDAVEPT